MEQKKRCNAKEWKNRKSDPEGQLLFSIQAQHQEVPVESLLIGSVTLEDVSQWITLQFCQ